MSIKKKVTKEVVEHIEIEFKDKWECYLCEEVSTWSWSYPRDYMTFLECDHCENETELVDPESVARYETEHLGVKLSKDGYEWEKV